MQGEHTSQNSFFGMIYEDLIPADHLLCKLAAAVDLSFVSELVSDCYCLDNGRPSWDPLVLFKVVFLLFDKLRVVSNVEPQFLYDLSDQEIEEQVNLHLAIDADSELITAVAVTPGNVADSQMLGPLLDPHAREVTADKGYDTNANHQRLKSNGQRSSIIVKKNRTDPKIISQANPQSQQQRPNIERKFAEQKKYHGLAKARYWGLARVTMQVLLTCIVVNCKKMAKLMDRHLPKLSPRPGWAYS